MIHVGKDNRSSSLSLSVPTPGTIDPALQPYDFLGFGVGSYRGFSGDGVQRVGPFGKLHVIAGQNNSGKSTLMGFCQGSLRSIPTIGRGGKPPFSEDDIPLGDGQSGHRFGFSIAFRRDAMLAKLRGAKVGVASERALDALLSSIAFSLGDPGVVWIDYAVVPDPGAIVSARLVTKAVPPAPVEDLDVKVLQSLSMGLCGQSSSNMSDNYGNIVNRLAPYDQIPDVVRITAIRHISATEAGEGSGLSGGGLNDRLSALENPELRDRAVATRRWGAFIRFVRGVLNDPEAEVDVSSATHSIAVRTGGTGYLPLSSLGTGIEELVIIAAEVACTTNKLICIEEPEIHLHPSLQARLMRYLMEDDGGNRFLVTTHSPSVINTPGATITQVCKRGGVCSTRRVACDLSIRETLDDMGARPSDLLQTDFVVWVEGPSDRIYVRSWLSRIDPELTEGAHYSIMFYGGKLLNSLDAGAEDREAWLESRDDLISLFRMGSHFCVLMDSDRANEKLRANQTKYRIRRECEGSGNLAWITDYRTIENYVPEGALRAAISACHPGKKIPNGQVLGDSWTCPLSFKFVGLSYSPDKISVARALERVDYELDPKLVKHVSELAEAIRAANGMPPKSNNAISSKEDEK